MRIPRKTTRMSLRKRRQQKAVTHHGKTVTGVTRGGRSRAKPVSGQAINSRTQKIGSLITALNSHPNIIPLKRKTSITFFNSLTRKEITVGIDHITNRNFQERIILQLEKTLRQAGRIRTGIPRTTRVAVGSGRRRDTKRIPVR